MGRIDLIRHGQASLSDEDCDQLNPLDQSQSKYLVRFNTQHHLDSTEHRGWVTVA